MKQPLFLIVFILSLLLGQNLYAQQKDAGRDVIVRCLSFAKMKTDKEVYLHSQSAASDIQGVKVRLKTYLNHERATIKLVGGGVIFSRSSEAVNAEKESVAHVKVPARWQRVLFVFFPQKKGAKDSYRILVLDDSKKEFPSGSIQCCNLSSQTVRLTLEKKIFDLKPGSRRVIQNPPVNAANHTAMYAYVKKGDEWQRIGACLWPHPGRKRVLQFFYLDPVSKRVQLSGIKDVSVK